MPRANRFFLPGHVWHITHRCHRREFLFKFSRDRTIHLRCLFEARKRFGVCVLNYVVTSNHVHLLVRDKGEGEIAQSMQLIAGRTAQQYNTRKKAAWSLLAGSLPCHGHRIRRVPALLPGVGGPEHGAGRRRNPSGPMGAWWISRDSKPTEPSPHH
jgi:REP element-mobilizing transposase RayT